MKRKLGRSPPAWGEGILRASPPGQVSRSMESVDHAADYHYKRLGREDGLIEYLTVDKSPGIYPGNSMAVVGNALLAVEQLRRASREPQLKYDLEIEIRSAGNITVIDYNYISRELTLANVCDRINFSVGAKERFASLCTQIERRLWKVWRMRPRAIKSYILIDFEQALQAL
jgi:hypothetical protein